MTSLTNTGAAAAVSAHNHGQEGQVPIQTRSERPKSQNPSDFSVPNGREVDWRYTPVKLYAPLFENAGEDTDAVEYEVTAPQGVAIETRRVGEAPRQSVFHPEDLPSAITASQCVNGLFIEFPDNFESSEPVRVQMRGSDASRRALPHLTVRAGKHSVGQLILEHAGSITMSENVELVLDDGANLECVTVQEWNDDAVHTAAHQASVGRDATLKHLVFTFGGKAVRVNPSVHLDGQGASTETHGLYFSDAGQYFEQQVYIDHAAPNTYSRVTYKGALQGQGARGVWIGDVLIREAAEGTDSYEQNRNLILSDGARADSVPNLEIETGEIEGAGHASATGRFEDEQLFYLMSRGIDEPTARRLVVLGFLNEIVQFVSNDELAAHLRETLDEELAQSTSALLSGNAR